MIAADDHALSLLESKYSLRQRAGFDGIKRVLLSLTQQLEEEERRTRHSRQTLSQRGRARAGEHIHIVSTNNKTSNAFSPFASTVSTSARPRNIIQDARQREIAETLSLWRERLSLTVEDAHSRLGEFCVEMHDNATAVALFLRESEREVVPAKEQWKLRVNAFTATVMDDLYAHNSNNYNALRSESMHAESVDEESLSLRRRAGRGERVNVSMSVRETVSVRETHTYARQRESLNTMLFLFQQRATDVLTGSVLRAERAMDVASLITQLHNALPPSSSSTSSSLLLSHISLTQELKSLCATVFHALHFFVILFRNTLTRVRDVRETHDVSLSQHTLSLCVCVLEFIRRMHDDDDDDEREGERKTRSRSRSRSPSPTQRTYPITTHSTRSTRFMDGHRETERDIDRIAGTEMEMEEDGEAHTRTENVRQQRALLVRALLPAVLATLRAFAELRLSLSSYSLTHSESLSDSLSTQWHAHGTLLCESVVGWNDRLSERTEHSLRRSVSIGTHSLAQDCLAVSALFAQSLISARDEDTRKHDRRVSVALTSKRSTSPTLGRKKNDTVSSKENQQSTVSALLSLAKAVLTSALRLSASCAASYAISLGGRGHAFTLCVRDTWFFAVRDGELVAALDLAATAFSLGLVFPERERDRKRETRRHRERKNAAVRVLREAGHALRHRSGAVLLALSFVKCTLAAALFVLRARSSLAEKDNEKGLEEDTENNDEEQEIQALSETVASLVGHVLTIFALHRTSLSVCHKCLLLLRVLFRDAFLSKHSIEDVFSFSLVSLVDPWQSEDKQEDEASVADDESDRDSDGDTATGETGSVSSAQMLYLDQSLGSHSQSEMHSYSHTQSHIKSLSSHHKSHLFSTSSLLHGSALETESVVSNTSATQTQTQSRVNNKNDNMPVDVYLSKLHAQLFSQSFFRHDPTALSSISAPSELLQGLETLPELVRYVVETHQQTSEVMEQALLLIEHLGSQSSLMRFQFVETGLPLILSRYLDTRPSDVYIVALGEICQDLLDV